jgi:hypothetical protein
MKNFLLIVICTVLSALFTVSCNLPEGDHKYFESKLRGTWGSNEPGLYSGTLTIDYDTITIDGYGEDWLSLVGDDSKRPFKDFPKRVALKGYSEEGKIYIEYGGNTEGIPYVYTEAGSYTSKVKILEFNFGGRPERLQMDY